MRSQKKLPFQITGMLFYWEPFGGSTWERMHLTNQLCKAMIAMLKPTGKKPFEYMGMCAQQWLETHSRIILTAFAYTTGIWGALKLN